MIFVSKPRMAIAILAVSSFTGAQAGQRIAGYYAETDVSDVIEKDLIQKEFETLMGEEDCDSLENGKEFYTNGDGKFLADLPTYTDKVSPHVATAQSYFQDQYFWDTWVTAALNKEDTAFERGNAKFTAFPNNIDDDGGCVGFEEGAKKFSNYVAGMVEIFQFTQAAIDLAAKGCSAQTDGCKDAISMWDNAVAYFVGSLEGEDGNQGTAEDGSYGKSVYTLADKRCDDYAKCGVDGKSTMKDVPSKANLVLINLFAQGAQAIWSGDAMEAKKIATKIDQKMSVPFIQGTLRYTYRLGNGSTKDKEVAEGYTFAMGVLPKLWKCSAAAAELVESELGIGQGTAGTKNVDFKAVEAAFQCNYNCMGVLCSEVGSLFDGDDSARLKACKDPKKVCGREKKKFKKFCKIYRGKGGKTKFKPGFD
uniref:Alginate lyase domain-containing protein n=2 Tax=Pseudo-nitzschia australis TaxID=44445 RepID=A0A6U9WM99_9STRA|mmetsp:Transcript_1612/g.3572  ORF Transcript_1612/g.3572 Transcript_1612/m.3572 type:complete len:421 (+) Transcript_1612:371-1633(+)|eukprot:CAMPEP_0168311716 /NCGR_PEP_ID=MMETSP0142_2-20121227/67511_1 /TAXON_ID=44445 /ORGANISM="Pseudo-nitzschia australis, Strain 10249 10 AB" /LENGTH=420 /DNA_ID=CAMNT_0008264627 /DNA_START=516 /DNA_END=1778 /DNA_ORIENTATION=-